jgi:hypothetical protein
MKIALMVVAALAPLWAQEIKMPANLDTLSAKAIEAVDVTLDGSMLRLLARFADKEGSDADVKKLLAALEGIYVRSYQFATEGEYNNADVDAVRTQFQPPAWARVVGVRSKRHGNDVDVYFKTAANGTLGGVVVISAEPRELTIVNIAGTIDPAQLSHLGGHFHIPALYLTESKFSRRESQ